MTTDAPVVLATDQDGVVTFTAGDAGVLGLEPGQIVGRSLSEVCRDRPEVVRNHRAALAGHRLSSTVTVGEAVFETHHLPTFDAERVAGAVLIATDVTERNRAEDDLRSLQALLAEKNAELGRANAHKDDFIAKMSHEFRTPLTAIIGFSELLKDDAPDAPSSQQLGYLDLVLDAGHHLLALVNDLLDLSKVRSGTIELSLGPVDLVSVATEALEVVESAARKKKLGLNVSAAADTMPLVADARRVKQVLDNLLANAVKFTPAGGLVQVSVFEGEGEVCAEVTDTGPGVPARDQERLFKAFTQLGDPRSEGYSGAGLGLVLAKQLVALHGGRMWLRSQPGRGSTFGFALPRRATVAAAPTPEPEELYGD